MKTRKQITAYGPVDSVVLRHEPSEGSRAVSDQDTQLCAMNKFFNKDIDNINDEIDKYAEDYERVQSYRVSIQQLEEWLLRPENIVLFFCYH